MSKIGRKIVWSYLILILVTSLVFLAATRTAFGNFANRQTREQLIQDSVSLSNYLSEQLQRSLSPQAWIDPKSPDKTALKEAAVEVFFKDLPRHVLGAGAWLGSQRLASTHLLIQDNHQKVWFESYSYGESPLDPISIDSARYFVERRPILLLPGKEKVGSVVLLARKEDLTLIDQLISRSALIAFLSAIGISMLLALYFERTMISPVKVIKKNIQGVSMEEDIPWKNLQTRDELSDINRDFYEMVQNLRAYDRRQKEFFQNTSHELKTPIMSIQGYAEAIKDQVIEGEQTEKALDIIIDESKKLTETVNGIVYLGKLRQDFSQAGREPCHLYEMVDERIALLAPVLREQGLRIENKCHEQLLLYSEPEKIKRILNNIISNSLRYARHTITIRTFVHDPAAVRVRISDDGKGFEEGEEERIFDRFYKGKGGNTGLGLAIVQSIAQTNHWQIKAYNFKGAVIDLIIPWSDAKI